MREAEIIASGFPFPEGPRWHDGCLYFVDHIDCTVRMVGDDGEVMRFAELPARMHCSGARHPRRCAIATR